MGEKESLEYQTSAKCRYRFAGMNFQEIKPNVVPLVLERRRIDSSLDHCLRAPLPDGFLFAGRKEGVKHRIEVSTIGKEESSDKKRFFKKLPK